MKCMRKVMAVLVVSGMLYATNIVAFAGSAYDQGMGYAGTTKVVAEVGYSGTHAYARVSALAYVDATMDGTVEVCYGVERVTIHGAFNQSTYGEATRNCSGEITMATCDFKVYSDDGTWAFYGVAANREVTEE